MLCFTLGYESKTLCFVRYLSLTEAAGYNGEGADEQLIPAFEYSVRPPKSKLRGAARALAGQAWYAVEPASSIVHRVHMVPTPRGWKRSHRGRHEVTDTWYLNGDVLAHGA